MAFHGVIEIFSDEDTLIEPVLKPPRTPSKRATELSKNQRLQIRTLRQHAKFSYKEIAKTLGIIQRQIQIACAGPITPQKKKSHRGYVTIRTHQRDKIHGFFPTPSIDILHNLIFASSSDKTAFKRSDTMSANKQYSNNTQYRRP